VFKGAFREGEEQSVTLEEIDGVVTPRSVQMLLQWVCLGRLVFAEEAPDVAITAAVESARLADMCGLTGMESFITEHIKAIILTNRVPPDSRWDKWREPDTNTRCCLTSQHISSAVALPEGHPVRAMLAAAAVEGCLRLHYYPFESEASKIPGFAADLLNAVRATMESVAIEYNMVTFEDPISGVKLQLKRT
jgi:hypothetical protein